MELSALAEGNAAVGNPPFAAGLEITIAGPEIELLQDVTFAIAGAPLEASLSGRKLDPSSPHLGRKGERLKLGFVRQGVRAYVCLQGGLALPLPGAQATALRSGVEIARADGASAVTSLPPRRTGWAAKSALIVRAIPGPQTDYFTAAGRETFFSSEYRVSPQSDRRGLRLDGPLIDLLRSADLPPEGTAPGAVQVPGGGLPIVLGPDRPPTGGYPKIATVIGTDLPLLAQARPGTTIRFRPATLEEALAARRSSR
jgi:antagonist of KipI